MHPGFLTLQVSFEMTHRGTRGLKLYCCSSQKTGTGGWVLGLRLEPPWVS